MEEKQYWGTIGAGILPICLKTNRILLDLRSPYVNSPGIWNLFGGKLDIDEGVDESIQIAALRELEEETGYHGEIKLIPSYIFRDTILFWILFHPVIFPIFWFLEHFLY